MSISETIDVTFTTINITDRTYGDDFNLNSFCTANSCYTLSTGVLDDIFSVGPTLSFTDGSINYGSASDGVGTYTLYAYGGTVNSSYRVTFANDGEQVITKKALTVSSIPSIDETYGNTSIYSDPDYSGDIIYSNASPNPEKVTFTNSEGLDEVFVYATVVSPQYSTSRSLKAGTYNQITGGTAQLEGSDADNYTLVPVTSTGSITINKRALSASNMGVNETYAYIGSSINGASSTGETVTLGNIVPGDTVSATARIVSAQLSTSGNLKAGTYDQIVETADLTGTDADNYTLETTTFTDSIDSRYNKSI